MLLKDTCSVVMEEATADKLNVIPMSDNTIEHFISGMASDVKEKLLGCVRESPFFSIQLDDNTKFVNCAQLMVNVHTMHDLWHLNILLGSVYSSPSLHESRQNLQSFEWFYSRKKLPGQ